MMPKDIVHCGKMFSMENFGEWLLAELEKRGMNQSDLARASGLNRGTISNIINGSKGIGTESLTTIARALRLPPETVFQAAGLLPIRKDVDPWVEEQKFVIEQLTGARRNIAERLLQGLLDEERAAKYETSPRPANAAKNA